MRSTQPFILSEIVRLNARLTRCSGVAFRKLAQVSFRHSKFRRATIQTDNELWNYPHTMSSQVQEALPFEATVAGVQPKRHGAGLSWAV